LATSTAQFIHCLCAVGWYSTSVPAEPQFVSQRHLSKEDEQGLR